MAAPPPPEAGCGRTIGLGYGRRPRVDSKNPAWFSEPRASLRQPSMTSRLNAVSVPTPRLGPGPPETDHAVLFGVHQRRFHGLLPDQITETAWRVGDLQRIGFRRRLGKTGCQKSPVNRANCLDLFFDQLQGAGSSAACLDQVSTSRIAHSRRKTARASRAAAASKTIWPMSAGAPIFTRFSQWHRPCSARRRSTTWDGRIARSFKGTARGQRSRPGEASRTAPRRNRRYCDSARSAGVQPN